MTRLDQAGGFGGPRVVKPQANVYTALLLAAVLFMAAALGVEIYRLMQLQKNPVPQAKIAAVPTASLVVAAADGSPIRPLV